MSDSRGGGVPDLLRYAIFAALAAGVAALAGNVVAGAGGAVVLAAAATGALLGVLVWQVQQVRSSLSRLDRKVVGVRQAVSSEVLAEVAAAERRATEREQAGTDRAVAAADRSRAEVAAARTDVAAAADDVVRRLAAAVGPRAEEMLAALERLDERGDTRGAQLEALLNLHAVVDVRKALPPTGGWAGSPDLLLSYVGEILARRPGLVVECGSGTSTVWAAYALEACGGDGRVVALESDGRFAEATRERLAVHGLSHRGEVRHAPIEDVVVGEERRPWYAVEALAGLDGIDVLFIDGPVGGIAAHARYPAMPLLAKRLSAGAVVLLDDADRPDERDIVERWCAERPGLAVTWLPHEKGTALLRMPDTDQPSGDRRS